MLKNSIVKDAVILFILTLIAGMLLGFTNTITLEPRAKQVQLKTTKALGQVLPDAQFELDLKTQLTGNIKEIYIAKKDDTLVGYAFKVIATEGYAGEIELIVGIDANGTIAGIDITKQAETPGLGTKADEPLFKDQFIGKNGLLNVIKKEDTQATEIAAISGATITSRAVTKAVNEVLEAYKTVGGNNE